MKNKGLAALLLLVSALALDCSFEFTSNHVPCAEDSSSFFDLASAPIFSNYAIITEPLALSENIDFSSFSDFKIGLEIGILSSIDDAVLINLNDEVVLRLDSKLLQADLLD